MHHDSSDPPTPDADGFLRVDPRRVRFQYSRIRPTFSGCGRSVLSTLDSIRNGELRPDDLPPILVLVGPPPADDEGGGRWYFSLNNRRLWVLKKCREEGLLEGQGNTIRARVREWKSDKERERYTVEKCALEAKFMREQRARTEDESVSRGGAGFGGGAGDREEAVGTVASDLKDEVLVGGDGDENIETSTSTNGHCRDNSEVDESDDDESDNRSDEDDAGGVAQTVNRFALCGFDSDSDTDTDED